MGITDPIDPGKSIMYAYAACHFISHATGLFLLDAIQQISSSHNHEHPYMLSQQVQVVFNQTTDSDAEP